MKKIEILTVTCWLLWDLRSKALVLDDWRLLVCVCVCVCVCGSFGPITTRRLMVMRTDDGNWFFMRKTIFPPSALCAPSLALNSQSFVRFALSIRETWSPLFKWKLKLKENVRNYRPLIFTSSRARPCPNDEKFLIRQLAREKTNICVFRRSVREEVFKKD